MAILRIISETLKTRKMVTLNLDKILPFEKGQYCRSTGLLSPVGFQSFWQQLNSLMRKIDRQVKDIRITVQRASQQPVPLSHVDPPQFQYYQTRRPYVARGRRPCRAYHMPHGTLTTTGRGIVLHYRTYNQFYEHF